MMKNLKYILCVLLTIVLGACNEDEWLTETALDFYSPENSFKTEAQFNAALANEYASVRNYYVTNHTTMYAMAGTLNDEFHNIYAAPSHNSNWATTILPESSYATIFWDYYYSTIFNMNVILDRIDDEKVHFTTEIERTKLKAEAMFFRGFAYRGLGILYGGVPIVLHEISAPKRDFVRASREEVFAQVIIDLEFAAANLPEVTELREDGRLTKAAANHLLSEVYIITQDWDKSISAASAVISDPNYALMNNRFGSWKTKPGDVYRDLFIRNNQNRNCAGGPNTEGIWVSQYEYNTPGGGIEYDGPRYFGTWYWNLQGKDGKALFFGHSSQNGGRAIGFCSANDYVYNVIWQNDPGDMRNSEYNIIRDMVCDNPKSAYFGQKIVENNAIASPGAQEEYWHPWLAKVTPFDNFPVETIKDQTTGATLNSALGAFTDQYIFRLSETYLLRAEAYLGKGNLASAADDINVVRGRANAVPVSPGDVNIEYILDERARELHIEEPRTMTLMRLGSDILVSRVRKYNPFYNGSLSNLDEIHDYNQFFPIPQSEIERNTEAILEQNPGYN
jgi:hypothetical protein